MMARIFTALTLFLAVFSLPQVALAQARLSDLAGVEVPRVLIAGGEAQMFEWNLPDRYGNASLSLAAWPSDPLPSPGQTFLVSINNGPATPLTPVAKRFSARFDIPASELRAGRNTLSIWLEPLRPGQCAQADAGYWNLSLIRSRLDVAIAGRVRSLTELEHWLAADIGGPRRISYDLSALSPKGQWRAGALLTQALALRQGHVPQITTNGALADLGIRLQTGTGPELTLVQSGLRPLLVIRGETEAHILQSISWLADNRLPRLPLPGPLTQWPKQALHTQPDLLTQLRREGVARFRLPPSAEARLLVDVGANPRARERTSLSVVMDGKPVAQPALWRRMNSIAIDLPPSQHPAHRLDLRIVPIKALRAACTSGANRPAPLPDLQMAHLQLAGIQRISDLEHLAWHGGRISNDAGKNSVIALPVSNPEALRQAWRVTGRLALLSGHALNAAQYVSAQDKELPQAANLLWISGRTHLPQTLLAGLPAGFAPHRGQAPGDPPRKYSPVNFISSAQAAAPDPGAPVGVAAIANLAGGGRAVVLSAEMPGHLAAVLADLSNGEALSRFSGTLVRWRGDAAMVNATATPMMVRGPLRLPALGYWLSILLVLLPTTLWSTLHLLIQQKRDARRGFTHS